MESNSTMEACLDCDFWLDWLCGVPGCLNDEGENFEGVLDMASKLSVVGKSLGRNVEGWRASRSRAARAASDGGRALECEVRAVKSDIGEDERDYSVSSGTNSEMAR